MSLPHNTWLSPELLTRLLNRESFIWWASFIALVLEGSFIFLMWIPRTRAILFIVGTSLHLGVLVAFPIPWFCADDGLAVLTLATMGQNPITVFNVSATDRDR